MNTISYEQVLQMTQKLDLREQLRLLKAITQLIQSQMEVPKRHSVMELEGLGAEHWHGLEAQEYVNEERASWDS